MTIKAGETATLKVSDTPKVTDTLIELFKIDMETQKDNPQGNASLAGAEFTWKYYACLLYTSRKAGEVTDNSQVSDKVDIDQIVKEGITSASTFLNSQNSVSYTHLDVYKRQDRKCSEYDKKQQ